MRAAISTSVFPVLLGDGKVSRRAARRLFMSFNLTSTVFDKKRSALSYLSCISRFSPLPPNSSDEFVLMSLDKIFEEHEEKTLLLIPCTEDYSDLVARNKSRLEKKFIIRTPENATSFIPDHSTRSTPIA